MHKNMCCGIDKYVDTTNFSKVNDWRQTRQGWWKQRAELLFGESITMKSVVGPLRDQIADGVAVRNWSVAGLEMHMLVKWCRCWSGNARADLMMQNFENRKCVFDFQNSASSDQPLHYPISIPDFQNYTIFAFIHDKNKQRIIEVCSITYHPHNTMIQNITIHRKNNNKRIQNSHL